MNIADGLTAIFHHMVMNKQGLYRIKYYLIILGTVTVVYIYAGLSGWKIFGTNTEQWTPEEQKGYHK